MKPRIVSVLLAGSLALLATIPLRAADPFYLGLFDSGTRDYLRGDYPMAAHKLRIACFGLLEEPPLLTQGLIRLALAQAGAGDDAGFAATFERVLQIEAAFEAYSALPDDTPFKAELERVLPDRVAAEDVAGVPAFAGVLDSLRQAKLTALPPKRLRRELEERIAADPRDAEALVLLTRLEISEDREQRAAERLAELLDADPENGIARCLRGQMRLRAGDCPNAIEDLAFCSAPPRDEVLGAHYLRCLIDASDWQAAARHLASLPLAVRSREEVSSLMLEIPPQALESVIYPSTDPVDNGIEPKPEAPRVRPEDRARADDLRRRLAEASTREAIAEMLAAASELAERYPDERDLQFLGAQIAYRLADWAETVRFFRRGGSPDSGQPLLQCYLAVALFETGQQQEAATVLSDALPLLEPTPFVERYRDLILGRP